ncbi:unnamed protein product [Rotaria sordida]|uniref:Uncharacterized protein n=1 Tax=Rotaria sordida TaxID=392033 RepID=A0A815HYM6_9BILA|nr:unnamed protein product [Rotaria sordida]
MIYDTGISSSPYAVVVGDFNSDSRLDIIVANYGTNNVGVFLGYGNGTFANQQTYSTGDSSRPTALTIGDFNNDSRLDIAVANYRANNVGIFLGYGNGIFANQMTYSTGVSSGPIALVIGDINNDSRLDIAVANYGTNNIGSHPQSIALGDFNNDYRQDIVVAHSDTGSVGVLLNGDSAALENVRVLSTGSGSKPHGLTVGDFNNDDRLDIIITNNAIATSPLTSTITVFSTLKSILDPLRCLPIATHTPPLSLAPCW